MRLKIGGKILWMLSVSMIVSMLATGMLAEAARAKKAPRVIPSFAVQREQNQHHLAAALPMVYTTEPSVAFSFSGFTQLEPLKYVLQVMGEDNMKGTFFVTDRELQRNAGNIDQIAASGQDLEIGLRVNPEDGFDKICDQIQQVQQKLKKKYGTNARLVRQIYGVPTDVCREAISAMGCELVEQSLSVVQKAQKDVQNTDDVMNKIFGKHVNSLGRGQIVYIRADFYTNPHMAGDMVKALKKEKIDNVAYRTYDDSPEENPSNDSAYKVVSVRQLLDNKSACYKYPVPENEVPAELQPSYVTAPVNKGNFDKEFFARYIGTPDVNDYRRMMGFNGLEIIGADKSGVVKNVSDNTIFLTFDDWGNDNALNPILYVLRKHHVTATFFILTGNIQNHPNLLRAIAMEGNEIGCHTNSHVPMVVTDKNTKRLAIGMKPDAYDQDVRKAYEKLVSVVGNVTVDGRPSLTRYFRPPALEMNKPGTQALLNAGYSYIISGYGSTEDYAALKLSQLVGAMQEGIYTKNNEVRKGSILIMHMIDSAKYTPRALDILLTVNERRPEGDPKKFKVGRLGDYLQQGYSQQAKSINDGILKDLSRVRNAQIGAEEQHGNA